MVHRPHAHGTVSGRLDMPPADWQQTPPRIQTLVLMLLKHLHARAARLQQDAPLS
jgi:hypothetical protein